MGIFRNNRISGILGSLLIVFTALGAEAAGTRYLVKMKSSQGFRSVKAESISAQRQGVGLFGTSAVAQDYLDNLDMMVVESNDRASLALIEAHPDVEAIEQEKFFEIPRVEWPSPQSWSLNDYRQQDLTWGLEAINAAEAWETTKGAGIRVMILDSGIDQNHPDLANRFEKARSFMGATYDDKIGHGTHVSGTILADGAESGLMGVAPEAKLLMGKVCDTSCSSVGISQGVNWAIEEKVDVVNMSLGGPFMFETQVYQKAEDANIVIVAAAGNNGKGNLSYPAALPSTLAVGAVNPDLTRAEFSQYGRLLDVMAPGVNVYSTVPVGMGRDALVQIDLGEGFEKVQSAGFQNSNPGDTVTTGELVFAGLGKPQDFENNKTTGKIALIERGEITFQEKVTAAQNAGATGVVIFNNEAGIVNGGLDSSTSLPVMMIERTVGQAILQKLNQGGSVSAELSIAASNYSAFSGTSMASPHTAGVVALVRAANKSLNAVQVKNLMRETATPLLPNPDNQMGRGLIDAAKAVEAAL